MTHASGHEIGPNDIAIIGLSGRFPGCRNVEQFWRALRDGVECIRPLTDEQLIAAGVDPALLDDPNYVKATGPLDQMEYFDAGFFGFSPKDAGIMDPQHRHFYECAWEALEHAGHTSRNFDGAIGVFAGCGPNVYFMRHVMTNPDLVRSVGFFLLRHTGNDRDFLPTGVSYRLDLRGPSIAIQTACSTSLVATHVACQSLLNGECDMALAGGVTITIPHGQGYLYRENEIHSPDGHCRAFDARSAGTVITSGVGVVLLRRLEDALEDGDLVHAVIRGSAINNDGAGKVGYLAPSVDGHAEVVAEALALAGLTAEDISYLEAHGTGTSVGDPIEIAALSEAFRRSTDRAQFCPIGSVKSAIGHTDTAAGVAGLIKVVEALKHHQIPPSLHFESPNPRIDFAGSPFFVNNRLRDWPSDGPPRRAGISSLGVGGTNAHVIVQEAPPALPSDPARPWELLVLSAKTPTALDRRTDDLAAHFREHADLNLSDVAHTLQVGREPFEHRRIVAVQGLADAAGVLEARDPQRLATGKFAGSGPSLVFMFPGGGAQYPDMGRGLYDTEPVYREAIDECLTLLRPHLDFDLRSLMFPAPGGFEAAATRLRDVTASICSIFSTSYAAARLWMSKGFEPQAMTGHSLGEYVAACLAGVFSLEDALRIVTVRGRVMSRITDGAMMTIGLPESEVRELIGSDIDLSAINGPELCLVSGTNSQLVALQRTLEQREVDCRLLHIAAASHCRLLDPVLDEFRAGIRAVTLNPPQRRFICNVTGTWARPDDVTDPEYWVRHFRQPVRFSQGLGELLSDPARVLLEVGPGTTLCSLARQQPTRPRGIVSTLRHPTEESGDVQTFLTAVGRLWMAGVDMDWKRLRGEERRQRLPLPTYPFERQRYWIEPGQIVVSEEVARPVKAIRKHERIDDWFYEQAWNPAEATAADAPPVGPTLVFADATGLGSEIARRLRESGTDVLVVREGDAYYKFDDSSYALAPEEGRAGYDSLFAELAELKRLPAGIIHCWMVTADESHRPGSSFFHRNQERGYYSLVFLMQALGDLDHHEPLHIDVVSNGMQAVGDESVRYPDKATLLGPVRVIPHEFGHITVRSIDAAPADFRPGKAADDRFHALVGHIMAEWRAAPANEVVAYRNGTRFLESVQASSLPDFESSRFRTGGVYLITGGLGGIGMKLAEHLARRHQAKLILIGRHELPPRKHWNHWLDTHGERDRTCRLINSIRELEGLGATVMPAAADVANIERMRAVIAEALDRFGRINGVIHAAAVLEDGVIQAKTVEAMERVFTPKVHGTLLLADLLKDVDLDFFVLFASTSSILGPAGQVDYTAANCFLNALARSQAVSGRNFVAIDWGVWCDIGAGREIARRIKGEEIDTDYLHQRVDHPLLGECLVDRPDEVLFSAELRVSDCWLLDEHRTRSGQALIPGTGYLEIARGSFTEATRAACLEIRDLTFLAPLAVGDDEPREMRTALRRENDHYAFEVSSRISDGPRQGWTTNATGSVRALDGSEARSIDIDAIVARCTDADGAAKLKQAGLLRFGPRFDVLREARLGAGEAIARLELPDVYAGDLTHFRLHPAVIDLATGFALPLLKGYDESAALYVPLSYGRVRVLAPLPSRIVSVVRSDPGNAAEGDVASFDIVIADESGRILVEIDRFIVRRIDDPRTFARPDIESAARADQSHLSQGERLFLDTIENGILAEEGMEALERILSCHRTQFIYASSIDLPQLIEREGEVHDDPDESGVKFDRPELQSRYEAPRDAVEKALAEFWEDLLGVSDIGINDDFFELGGHSLIAVRLFAKIKKKWGVEYPISVLFQAPTIASGAALLREELGVALGDEQPAEPKASRPKFTHLVPMTATDRAGQPPFFLVAGMFGNVLNLRHLAAHLGEHQTVYALQARGLHGEDKPHTRFEDMARDYLAEVRQVQPHGPYFLGGFSGGGITAYEMAQQLLSIGEEIGMLAMLDSPPARVPLATRLDRLRIQAIRLREGGLRYPIDWLRNRLDWELRRFRRADRELTPAEFRSEEIETAFREACDHYQHQPYPGRIVLFRPQLRNRYVLGPDRVLNEDREYVNHENHWRQHVRGGIDVHIVTGDHDSMVLEPHVRVLAAELKSSLQEAQRQYASKPAARGREAEHADAERRPQYQ